MGEGPGLRRWLHLRRGVRFGDWVVARRILNNVLLLPAHVPRLARHKRRVGLRSRRPQRRRLLPLRQPAPATSGLSAERRPRVASCWATAAEVIVHTVFCTRACGNACAQGYETGRYRMMPLADVLVGAVVADGAHGLDSFSEAMVAHVELSPSLIFLVAMTGGYTHSLHHCVPSNSPPARSAATSLRVREARGIQATHTGQLALRVPCLGGTVHRFIRGAPVVPCSPHVPGPRHSNLVAVRRGGWPLVGHGRHG